MTDRKQTPQMNISSREVAITPQWITDTSKWQTLEDRQQEQQDPILQPQEEEETSEDDIAVETKQETEQGTD